MIAFRIRAEDLDPEEAERLAPVDVRVELTPYVFTLLVSLLIQALERVPSATMRIRNWGEVEDGSGT